MHYSKRTLLAALVASSVFYSCKNNDATTQTSTHFLEASNVDSSVKPGDNFFLYANGNWIKNTEIPGTESGVGSFRELQKRTQANMRSIVEELATGNHAKGSLEQQVGDYYAAGMDSATIEKRGFEPVKPYLDKAQNITDVKGVIDYAAEQQTLTNSMLFYSIISADEKNSSRNIVILYQGGLGLPDRDYYFKTDAATQAVVASYKQYMTKLFQLTGDDSATALKNTTAVYELEKQMASSHRTNVELRDPQTNYNKMAVAQLNSSMPNIGWNNLFDNMRIKTDSVNMGQPAYFKKLNDLLAATPLQTWKTYLRFHTLDESASLLSSDFVNASFQYHGKALSGQQQIKPRWERMINSTDQLMGEALGQLYVKKFFTEDAKKRMMDLVNNLKTAYEARIKNLDWMSDSTKEKATAKLNTFLRKIGFPDKWKDYSKVEIDKTKYYENVVSAAKNEYNYQVSKVGQPVDRTEWGMTPPTINAYYNPTFNEIVFPAGILQFPFFDPNADDAINYGGIGMVIGHEMTHGFDDQGAQYDKEGNMVNWWNKADETKFKEKGKLVVNQYNGFTMLDSLHVNGALTLGENMADIGGIAIAYDAFKLTKQGKDTVKIDGLTPDQRFFLSYAQIWRSKMKDESIRQRINTDPHSPAMHRVNGPLMNFAPFYAAFNVQPGDKMYKPENERIKIW